MQTVFVKDLDSVIECILSKLMGNTKLGGVVGVLKGKVAIQGTSMYKKRAERNLIKFNETKCQVLQLEWKSSLQQYGLESRSLGKYLGVLEDNKWYMSQQCALAAKKPKNLKLSINKCAARKSQEMTLSL